MKRTSEIAADGEVVFRLEATTLVHRRKGTFISQSDLQKELEHFAVVLREGQGKLAGSVYNAHLIVEMIADVVARLGDD